MQKILYFKKAHIFGVGFLIHYGGLEQYSIAWNEGPPERMSPEIAKHDGIEVIEKPSDDSLESKSSVQEPTPSLESQAQPQESSPESTNS